MVREWMRDHDLDKIFWRIVCVLLLMFAFNIKIVHLSWEQTRQVLDYKRKNYTKELQEYELNEFIKLYPKFKHDIILQNKDIDQIAEYPDTIDWLTKRWFIYQAWDSQRFFYVQKRAQEGLGIIKNKKEAAGYIGQLEKRVEQNAQKEKDEAKAKGLKEVENKYDISKQMLELHQKQAEDNGDFSAEELALIEKKSAELKKLFD